MIAARWHGRRDVRIEDVPEPRTGPGQVKIRVAWCGISGTDLHEYESGPIIIPTEPHPLTGAQAPITMGHELAGEVVEVGDGVEGIALGDRVTCNSLIHCGRCHQCLRGAQNLCERRAILGLAADGGLCEFVCVQANTIVGLPDDFRLDWAALLEPVSTGVRAMRRGGLEAGEHVVVIGGGPIGLGCVQAALAAGAGLVHLVEPVESRRRLGESFGAVGATPEQLDELRGPRGERPPLVVDCVAVPATMQSGVALLPSGGRLVVVGVSLAPIPIDFTDVMLQEKTIIGTAGRRHEEDFATLIDLVDRGVVDLDSMITSRIAVEEIVEKGFEAMINDRERQVKILASPTGATA